MRQIHEIALEITRVWNPPYFGAVPYLDAMASLGTTKDDYGQDSGVTIVSYFLANTSTWRGPDARRIKTELKAHLGR